jgi:hypothetical protein
MRTWREPAENLLRNCWEPAENLCRTFVEPDENLMRTWWDSTDTSVRAWLRICWEGPAETLLRSWRNYKNCHLWIDSCSVTNLDLPRNSRSKDFYYHFFIEKGHLSRFTQKTWQNVDFADYFISPARAWQYDLLVTSRNEELKNPRKI